MTFFLRTHVKGQLDKGCYKVFTLSCSSGVHTQPLWWMTAAISDERKAGHDTNFTEFLDTLSYDCHDIGTTTKTYKWEKSIEKLTHQCQNVHQIRIGLSATTT